MTELTEEQCNSLRYFWEERQDIERYADFEKLKHVIQSKHPELLKAWENYKISIRIMNAVIRRI